MLAGLARLLRSSNLAILDEACVLLSQLSEGSDRWIQGILDTGAYKQLLRLARYSMSHMRQPTLVGRRLGDCVLRVLTERSMLMGIPV